MQSPRNGVLRLAGDSDFGRGEDRDRAEHERCNRCNDSEMNDLDKVYVWDVVVESENRDDDQV